MSKNVGATAHYGNVVVLASSLDALHSGQIERYFTAPVPLVSLFYSSFRAVSPLGAHWAGNLSNSVFYEKMSRGEKEKAPVICSRVSLQPSTPFDSLSSFNR